ncbi:glycosyltransferase family 9 protein [Hippea maritima]|uniref:Glycosyl transferase family 9 n=1 Tax=Hippea maritima (strain ATCC 700847 / DSM 10411 / MH2) TaxID=760142 RepID=F2LUC5_HIPMA|nr:glycosyltransferase family 9 protein [Hippea maritima]AEA33451.1 glycosyl transferase family 9 [Hippea maritima DSM 10411]
MKILVIQIRQLGDVLLSSPLAEAIKVFDSSYEVHFLTSKVAYPILSENPFIDDIVVLEDGLIGEFKVAKVIRANHYDAVLDIQRTGRSKRLTFLSSAKIRAAFDRKGNNFYYNTLIKKKTRGYTPFERLDLLKAVGIENPKRAMPKLFFSDTVERSVLEYLKGKDIDNYFVVAPAARKKTKMWDAEKFGMLASKLSKHFGLKAIVVYGSEAEREIGIKCSSFIKDAHLIEKPFDIKSFAALIKNASFMIGNDSFASHVGVSQNTKTVVVCGPTSGWFLENNNTLLVYKGLKCQPCNNPSGCRFNFACYKELDVDFVLEKSLAFLSE